MPPNDVFPVGNEEITVDSLPPPSTLDNTDNTPKPPQGTMTQSTTTPATQPIPPSGDPTRPQRSGSSRRTGSSSNGNTPATNTNGNNGVALGSSTGMSPATALKLYGSLLSDYEQSEVFDYTHIYFVGNTPNKIQGSVSNPKNNHGYDDDRGDYLITQHDHLGFRYEALQVLGKGSFGQVLKAFDYRTNTSLAIKIIRNKKRFHHQAQVEVKILDHLRKHDQDDLFNTVKMLDSFYFRNHLCITFELMSMNLYELIKTNNFQGLSLPLIRRFCIQLLASLKFLDRHRIIHCDLKPENILLKQPTKPAIKLIDFGSSCFEHERVYTYIQSRFYRAPEIILGISYNRAIDLWSFGCIVCELYTGYPIFPGENEVEQLACIMEVLDLPPKHMIEMSSRRKQFFDSNMQPRIVPNSRGKRRRPGTKDLATCLRNPDPSFLNFIEGFLRWDPRQRFTPDDGFNHPWILEGLKPKDTPPAPRAPSSEPPERRRPRQTKDTKPNENGSTNEQSEVLNPHQTPPNSNSMGTIKANQPAVPLSSLAVDLNNSERKPRPTASRPLSGLVPKPPAQPQPINRNPPTLTSISSNGSTSVENSADANNKDGGEDRNSAEGGEVATTTPIAPRPSTANQGGLTAKPYFLPPLSKDINQSQSLQGRAVGSG